MQLKESCNYSLPKQPSVVLNGYRTEYIEGRAILKIDLMIKLHDIKFSLKFYCITPKFFNENDRAFLRFVTSVSALKKSNISSDE